MADLGNVPGEVKYLPMRSIWNICDDSPCPPCPPPPPCPPTPTPVTVGQLFPSRELAAT